MSKFLSVLFCAITLCCNAELIQIGTDPLDGMPLLSTPEQEAVYKQNNQGNTILDDMLVIVPKGEYTILTGRLDRVWKSMNSTRSGRIDLHGRVETVVVDEEQKTKIEVHTDGYCHVEKFELLNRKVREQIRNPGKKKEVKPDNISQRQWEARLARKRALAHTNEVTVITTYGDKENK